MPLSAPTTSAPTTSAPTTSAPTTSAPETSAPPYHVIKRDGRLVAFDPDKVRVAVTRAYVAVEGDQAAKAQSIHQRATLVADTIARTMSHRMPSGGSVHIEDIQDQVELCLMRMGQHKIARAYVLYREEHARQRQSRSPAKVNERQWTLLQTDGSKAQLTETQLRGWIEKACEGLSHVAPEAILNAAAKTLYDGLSQQDLASALIMAARPLVEQAPEYSQVCARFLLQKNATEALDFLGLAGGLEDLNSLARGYPGALAAFVAKGIELDVLDERLSGFDLARLGQALHPERDYQFQYLGLQTLYDRYLIKHEETRYELPQVFFMRVAMGLALNEDDPNARAIEFYEVLSRFDYMASTPTLFNSGTRFPQLSSCYLTTVPDDLEGIYGALKDNAMLSKWAGGLGNDWTPVRALGAFINGTQGRSQGVVPFLKVVNDTAVAVNQGGKRKGAVCAYLETWHMDVEEFLELRKNTGDDRRRTHDMNTAHWVPDLFMERVFREEDWTLFSPDEVGDLHDLYGEAFRRRYEEYEQMAERGELRLHKKVPAMQLWRRMISMLFETGHPWITFKDACNLRSPQQHCGVVHSSNLCTEITLNTSNDEIAVCNLGSINLLNHLDGQREIDRDKLQRTVSTAVRMLDNVIDINYYAVPQARNANARHRPVGLGIMGFQDCLHARNEAYGSEQAVAFADQSQELISYYALASSCAMASERGRYQTFEGSLWSEGVLPIDSVARLSQHRSGDFCKQDCSQRLDWDRLRQDIRQLGLRNSNVMAIAPTATIANIVGVSASIEPAFKHLYVKSNLSGEFTVINPWLVEALRDEGLWDEAMVNDLKYYDGSIQAIERIPAAIRQRFETAFELAPKWLIECASRRQKWLDQAQSLNLYFAGTDGRQLEMIYRMAWLLGLKTTYYLRTLGATSTEKSTLDRSHLNAVTSAPVCSLDDPDCEACQ